VVVAHDTGKAIKGRKLDLFIGTRSVIGRVGQTGVTRAKGVKVYWLDPPAPGSTH
jgi:3D (Asp-Asp-Asp) domain-containing protein